LYGSQLTTSSGCLRVSKHAHPNYPWCDLLEDFKPFCAHTKIQTDKPGDVTARVRKTIYKAAIDRIDDLRKHNRNCRGLLLQRSHHERTIGENYVRCPSDQFCAIGPHPIGVARSKAHFYLQVAPFVPT